MVKNRLGIVLLIMASVTAVTAMASGVSHAAGADYYRIADNIAVYLGVLPAQMVQGHAPEHPEGKMHGGIPVGARQHHIVIAIFDASDGSRISNAAVTARVAEIGLALVQKKLELMTINKAASYGNYFSMGSPNPYRIEIEITRPNSTSPVRTNFDFSHPRR